MANFKTNVMRILDQKKIPYIPHEYQAPDGNPPDGVTVAAMIGKTTAEVYKTLVTQGASKRYYVFVVPSDGQLDLKKAAKAVGEKSVEMIKQKELLPLTGYVHGGCSPVGMKKLFKTVFHSDVLNLETVTVSAGKVGHQIEISPEKIIKAVAATTAEITV
ncbi:MAG: Cys-tRNA(Pro) deacylase [Clostridia bacterium]|nr:Cys-tRNA(Pro) deacylase [Clostridia bacterium]